MTAERDNTLRSATHKPKCSKAQIDILLSRDERLDASLTDALMTMRALLKKDDGTEPKKDNQFFACKIADKTLRC